MSQENPDGCLHLPDLSIENFRGIDHLSIDRLGRVTLLAGINGIGKTTVLDAIRIYAARGQPMVLTELLDDREELIVAIDESGDEVLSPDITSLFHLRDAMNENSFSIGSCDENDRLIISASTMKESSANLQKPLFVDTSMDEAITALKITFRNKERLFPLEMFMRLRTLSQIRRRVVSRRSFFDNDEWSHAIVCESLGPGLPSNSDMVRFWDRITLTDIEDLPIQALQLILDNNAVSRIAVIGDDDAPRIGKTGRRIIIRSTNDSVPIPLKSLGDGAIRLFGVALALANSRDGFLVIDEAENGIHHSLQHGFWRMILQTAHKDNVQVVATTHSWDCVRGFARAATEFEDAEGVLVRLERDDGGMRAIEYSEKELKIAAEQGIEVR